MDKLKFSYKKYLCFFILFFSVNLSLAQTFQHNPHQQKTRNIIIVIDPGHGGKDPGATGPRGIHEKTVVLAIAKKLQNEINEEPGMRAVLTRSGDYYLTLRERLRIAREHHADLFVAIHADAYPRRNAEGASVFALSERGATSEAARWLAEKENYSELGGIYLANKSKLLRSVLLDLSQTATITESLKLGGMEIHSLEQLTPLHSTKVEQARFVVLKSPDIPSLLIETGFITNPFEEKRLNSNWYQYKLAYALKEGIKKYFFLHPPENSVYSKQKAVQKYCVKKGDTLTQIVKKQHTSIALIKQLNHLHNNIIFVGQCLRLPLKRIGD